MCILAYNNYPQKQPKRKREKDGQKWRKVRLKTDPPADVNH